MKRIVFIMVAVMIYVVTAVAENVSPDAARLVAAKFLKSHGATLAEEVTMNSRSIMRNAANEAPAYYVFNAEDNQGFVIISGDDRTEPILGYSTSGSIDIDQMPENMRSWLQHYADQITALQQYDHSVPRLTTEYCGESIAPTLTSKWYQFPIYNAQLPMVTIYSDENCTQLYEYSDDQGHMITSPIRAITGCTTTAVAQVLYCHKYPAATTAYIPGCKDYVNPDKTFTDVPLWNKYSYDAIPAGTPIDWDNLADAYDMYIDDDGQSVNVTTTEVQDKAIASLMQICAAAINTKYGTIEGEGSAADDYDVLYGVINYLGLPNATACLQGFHDYQEWTQLLYDEVKAGGCAFFMGTSAEGGHSFVVDGYDKEDFFHINWGWSGRQDGYFRINDLTPDGIDLNKSQMFARGLYPGAPAMEEQLFVSAFRSKATSISSDEGSFTIDMEECIVVNEQRLMLNAQLGVTIEGEGQTITIPIDQEFQSIPYRVSINKNDEAFKVANLSDGEYLCYPCFRTSEAEEWKACKGKEDCYMKLTVSGTTMTIENVKPIELKVISSHPSVYEAGKTILLTPTLKVEKGNIYETIAIVITTRDDEEMLPSDYVFPLASLFCTISEGETFDVPLIIPAHPAGKYRIMAMLGHRKCFYQLLNIDIVEEPTSVMYNGPFTMYNSAGATGWFDLQGRKVQNPQKGIYIINGKAVAIE